MKYSNGTSTQCHAYQYPSLFPVLNSLGIVEKGQETRSDILACITLCACAFTVLSGTFSRLDCGVKHSRGVAREVMAP